MRIALLDDYQGVALEMADWTPLLDRVQVDVFRDHLDDPDAVVERLTPYDGVVLMRERTPLPGHVIERLPRLRVIVSTGRKNASVDVATARERGITVCATESPSTSTTELTWALILGLSRHLLVETANMASGGWQTTVGRDLAGSTLGVVGLGRIGGQVASVARAFGMQVLAWSEHLTPGRAAEVGATAVGFDELLGRADVVTIHQVLSRRTRGLVGAREIALMKPDALLVNTSRAPIVDTDALLAALHEGRIGGAGLDVYDEEPLPADHPLRKAPRTLLTPHIGYVTEGMYRAFFGGVVEDLVAYLDGSPIREL